MFSIHKEIKMSVQEILAKKAAEASQKAAEEARASETKHEDKAGPGLEDPSKDPLPSEGPKKTLAKGAYQALGLNQFFLASGFKISPVAGVYDPADHPEAFREEITAQLEYYAQQYGLVEPA